MLDFSSYRIIVMDRGEIVEFDKPARLLQSKKSLFHKMAKDAGIVRNGRHKDD